MRAVVLVVLELVNRVLDSAILNYFTKIYKSSYYIRQGLYVTSLERMFM